MRNTKDKGELLRVLMARAQELHLQDVYSLAIEFPDGLDASAPLLHSLTLKMESGNFDWHAQVENPLAVFTRSGDFRSHIFQDMTVQLQNLELSGFGFTKDWLACVNLRSVSVQFQGSWYSLAPVISPFTYLADLPNLETLHFSDGGELEPPSAQNRSVLTFNRLQTLTFREVTLGTLRDAFTWLNSPALQQFNLLCGLQL